MDTEDDKMQFILGYDVFNPEGSLLRERGTHVRDGVRVVTMEVGQTGVMVELKAINGAGDSTEGTRVNAITEEPA